MHKCMCRKYPITHVNMQEHPTYSNCHTPIYILKKKTHFHAQRAASNLTPNLYPKHFPFKNYLYMFEMYIIQIFIVSLIFIYMHVGKLITLCTHFCIQKGLSCHLSTLEGQFHIIYSFGKHSCAIFGMGTFFFERLLMLPIHKYTYFKRYFYATYPQIYIFEMHYLLFIHFARYFHAIYSHTLQHILMPYIHIYLHTIEKASPTLLRCKVPITGQLKSLQKKSLFSCFSNPKTKFWIPSHKHVFLH